MQRVGVLSLLVLVATCATARAEDANKSPAAAVSLSVGVTAAGAAALFVPNDGVRALGMLTIFVGPSVGRWYSGDASLSGLGLRTLGVATAFVAAASDAERTCDDLAPCTGPSAATTSLAVLAGALVVSGAVLDTMRGYQAASARHQRTITLAPTALVTPSSRAAGLALTGSF